MLRPLSKFTFRRYVSSAGATDAPDDACVSGSRNAMFTGREGKAVAYKGPSAIGGVSGSRVMFNTSDGYAGLGDAASPGGGNIFQIIARALLIIGSGLVRYNGASLGMSASTSLQIKLYRSGSYTSANTGPYTAGLVQPPVPTVAIKAGSSGKKNSGSFAVKIWRIRSSTGARSIASLASSVLVLNQESMRVTFPPLDSNGQDRWGIAVTLAGFGSTGPFYELLEIADTALSTIDGVPRSYELEWADGDVLPLLAPISDYPPPPAVFGCAIEDVSAVIGCYGDSDTGVSLTSPGTAIAVSLPGHPESYDPDHLLFLSEPPLGVLNRATDAYAFILCANSVYALTYTGGEPPLSLQPVWASVGVPSVNAACIAEGRLYAFTGKHGAVRVTVSDEPDSEFAADVADDMASWNPANVVVGYDADYQRVVYGHGTTLLCFNKQTERWDAPFDISPYVSGTITSMVTVNRSLRICTNTGASLNLYSFNTGSGTPMKLVSGWRESQEASDQIFRAKFSTRSDNTTNPITLKIFTDGDTATPVETITAQPVRSGFQHYPTAQPNITNAKSHCVSIEQQSAGGDCGPETIELWGESSDIPI